MHKTLLFIHTYDQEGDLRNICNGLHKIYYKRFKRASFVDTVSSSLSVFAIAFYMPFCVKSNICRC
uniref:Uncharacterized protein n=1 Tax=Octopus bimaculoides TaxID=37653 RepID=A0A0L8HL77_OCTBM